MEFRIVSLPPFTAATSGADPDFDFSPTGRLGRFSAYFSAIKPSPRDAFMPRDFLYYDAESHGMVWLWALCEGMGDGGFYTVDFTGGLYLCYAYMDGDDAEAARLREAAREFIGKSGALVIDESRPELGHIITPAEVKGALGGSQMECFMPIMLKE